MGQASSQEASSANPQGEEKKDDRPTPGKSLTGSEDAKKTKYEAEILRLFTEPPASYKEKLRVEKVQTEKSDFCDNPPKYSSVSWDTNMTVMDLYKEGINQRGYKRVTRSKADVWRRYGPLSKIHQIGGVGSIVGPKGPRFYDIKAGTPVPPAPSVAPLSTIDDYLPFTLSTDNRIKDDNSC